MDLITNVNCLKINSGAVTRQIYLTRQIHYVFKQLWDKVILTGMHPTGQILNCNDQSELQNRRTEHIHAPIYRVDAPKIDKNKDSEVVRFIDKYIACSFPEETNYPKMIDMKKKTDPPSCNHL